MCFSCAGEAPESLDIRVQRAEPGLLQVRAVRGWPPGGSPCASQSAGRVRLHLLPGRAPEGSP